MARGKIQIQKIENPTNRQVTYSKRRNGLFKKAQELSVLCDAKVSIIMFSGTNKLHEYISPSTTTKQVLDEYQRIKDVDLWSSQYKKMQDLMSQLQEINSKLRTEIRQRMGESLENLSCKQLIHLATEVENSVDVIRQRKFKMLGNQIENRKKKNRNLENINKNLHNGFVQYFREAREAEDPQFELVENGGDYESVVRLQHGIYALGLQQPGGRNFHGGSGSTIAAAFPVLDQKHYDVGLE